MQLAIEKEERAASSSIERRRMDKSPVCAPSLRTDQKKPRDALLFSSGRPPRLLLLLFLFRLTNEWPLSFVSSSHLCDINKSLFYFFFFFFIFLLSCKNKKKMMMIIMRRRRRRIARSSLFSVEKRKNNCAVSAALGTSSTSSSSSSCCYLHTLLLLLLLRTR